MGARHAGKGNARFSTSGDGDWVPPLSSEDAAEFVADPRTVAMVAIESASNHLAGFVYGTVMYRRHTKLRHLCVYEIGVDTDHREPGVGMLLLEGDRRRSPRHGHRPGVRLRQRERPSHAGHLRQRRRSDLRLRGPLRLPVLSVRHCS